MDLEKNKIKSVYIHIPFCDSICNYCDFCKFIKNDDLIYNYLSALDKEIKSKYKGEVIDTLYIGGGTPSSLDLKQLEVLFDILKIFNLSENFEFTFECNIENIDYDKLKFLYDNRVNRLSIGVETFNDEYLNYLNRHHNKHIVKEKINLAKNIGFKNINIDLIYALKGETIEYLSSDIDEFLKLDIPHISTYSLIIEPNTKLYIENEENIDEDLDYDMYKLICDKLESNGYNHYEISNFAKEGYESKHNLTYWNNLEYYGFGLGASGYVDKVRYDNTRSINNYIKENYVLNSNIVTKDEAIQNEFILGFRKICGINKNEFKIKYNIDIKSIPNVVKLIKEKKLEENKENIYINKDYIYVSNNILVDFIDLKI